MRSPSNRAVLDGLFRIDYGIMSYYAFFGIDFQQKDYREKCQKAGKESVRPHIEEESTRHNQNDIGDKNRIEEISLPVSLFRVV